MILRRHRSEERQRQGDRFESRSIPHRFTRSGIAGSGHPDPRRRALVVFAGLMLLLVTYFVGAEQGAMSLVQGMGVHELVHDGRHLLGFPCH